MTHQARGSRAGRVLDALHDTGTAGVLLVDLAASVGLKPYEVREILTAQRRKTFPKVTIIAQRRNAAGGTDEVYACCCTRDHHAKVAPVDADVVPPVVFEGLDEETIATGLTGVAAARAALEAAGGDRRSA